MALKAIGQALAGLRVEILATDLSDEVLEKAKAGIYSQFEVQRGLPIQQLVKYFTQVGEAWQIAPEIRAMVPFRPLNLLHDFGHLGSFDLVFCRNVLIYFDQDTKIGVLNRLARVVPADGFLVLGAAETVVGLTDALQADARQARALCAERPPPAPRRQRARSRPRRSESSVCLTAVIAALFLDSIFKQPRRQASSPVFFAAPGTPYVLAFPFASPEKTRARGTPGPQQPRSPVHDVSLNAQA